MLLGLMRKHAKSWLIKFLIAIIALVFIFYFGYSFTSDRAAKIAYVNGELVTEIEYQKAYNELLDRARAQYKDFWNDDMAQALQLRSQALQFLIDRKLMVQEAERLGMQVTTDEVQKAIMDYPAFQEAGHFDLDRYRMVLNQNRLNPEDFEALIEQDLLQEKLKRFLFAFLPVSEGELLEQYRFDRLEKRISYVRFPPDPGQSGQELDEEALKAYFESNRAQFSLPEAIQVSYITFDPRDHLDRVEVDEIEIEAYYEQHREDYVQKEQVRARHILFTLPEDAAEEAVAPVREKALKVLEEARQGADFAVLAQKHSQDPAASAGGDLGFFPRGRMEPAFETAAFNLQPGEISDLVRTPFGFHIIKLEEKQAASEKSFDEVKGQIKLTLAEREAAEAAREKALSLLDRMPYDIELEQFAAENVLEAHRSNYFDPRTGIEGLDVDPKKLSFLFNLEARETTEAIELDGKFYIFQLIDRKPPRLPELEEVRDKVEAKYRQELAVEAARNQAEAFLAALRSGRQDWDELVAARGLEVQDPPPFTRQGQVPGLGNVPEFTRIAFSLSAENPYPDRVFTNRQGAFAMRWVATEELDMEAFEQDRERLRSALMQAKQRRAFEAWLDGLKKQAEVEILVAMQD